MRVVYANNMAPGALEWSSGSMWVARAVLCVSCLKHCRCVCRCVCVKSILSGAGFFFFAKVLSVFKRKTMQGEKDRGRRRGRNKSTYKRRH